MAVVKLYGNLKQYGNKFKINADTAQEALNCLYLQIKGLKENIRKGFFKVRINGKQMTQQTIQFGLQSQLSHDSVIHITPVTKGAKNGGVLNIIAGAALVVIGVIGNIYGNWGTPFIAAGIGMMIGGVAQMLTKIPKMNDSKDENGKKNTSFSSLDNTGAQGEPIPLAYGEIMIGSKVESQGLETFDVNSSDDFPTLIANQVPNPIVSLKDK